jgi:hypothetical protein
MVDEASKVVFAKDDAAMQRAFEDGGAARGLTGGLSRAAQGTTFGVCAS